MQPIKNIFQYLKLPKNIVITTHQKPDGDALGSSIGLSIFLKKMGHNVSVISPTNWPNFLNWLPNIQFVIDFENHKPEAIKLIEAADFIFCLDFNVIERIKNMASYIDKKASNQLILIDHHQEPDLKYFEFISSDPTKSSTCELVYDFIVDYNPELIQDKDLAICLYTGLMTDSGSFRHPSTTSSSHTMAAHLLAQGINHTQIHDLVFDSFNENRLRFIGHCLLNCLQVFPEYQAALLAVSHADIQKYKIQTGDTEGLVNFLLTIQEIQVAAILIDRGDERKWSFRSKNNFNVSIFAKNYFNGGGHNQAAGGKSSLSFEVNIENFKNNLKIYINQNK